jgi:hypothetical protein
MDFDDKAAGCDADNVTAGQRDRRIYRAIRDGMRQNLYVANSVARRLRRAA